MSKLEFKPEDFPSVYECVGESHASIAQAKFDSWLKENGTDVWASMNTCSISWSQYREPGHTHKALLINIELIEQCTHPAEKVYLHFTKYETGEMKDGAQYLFDSSKEYKCSCGARVQPSGFEKVDEK